MKKVLTAFSLAVVSLCVAALVGCAKKAVKVNQPVVIENNETSQTPEVEEKSLKKDSAEERQKAIESRYSEEYLAAYKQFLKDREELWNEKNNFYNHEYLECTISPYNNPDYDEQMKNELKRVTNEINEFLNTSYTFEARRVGLPDTRYDDIPKFDWAENENKILEEYSQIISRTEDELVINLNNGEKKVYKNFKEPPEETDYTVYTFYKVDLEKEYVAIVTSTYHFGYASFINLNTGKETALSGYKLIDGFNTDYIVGEYENIRYNFQTILFFYKMENGESEVVKAISIDGMVSSVYVVDNVLIFYYRDDV